MHKQTITHQLRQTSQVLASIMPVRAIKGTLVECDESIKSIIISIDSEKNDFIIEDLDETHLLIKDAMVATLKARLEEASPHL